MATFAPGSNRTLSVVNYKDTNGVAQPLPAGMLPKFSVDPAAAAVFGTQNADGTQPVTFSAAFTGNATFTGTLVYPDGNSIKLTPITVTVGFPENVTADIAIA